MKPIPLIILCLLPVTGIARASSDPPAVAAPHHAQATLSRNVPYMPVVTPNGATLPWEMDRGVKVFHLTVESCRHGVAPGMVINAWCYNGQTPGPTIEAVEWRRGRSYVNNKRPGST